MRPFSIIVAFDSQYGIGKNGHLPWNLPSDLKHFKEITSQVSTSSKKNAVVMGRKTWESLPVKFRPLPGRINLVLSKREELEFPSEVLSAKSLDEALKQLTSPNIENVFIIGGAQIYDIAMEHPLCQKIYVTHVKGNYDCDAFFPPISRQFIPINASQEHIENGMAFHFSDYLRN